jgi:SpoVK/Ycf46/Vps4 family AAA+-type ATPase
MLDEAIWRRFDDIVMFPKPSPPARKKFIHHHLNGVTFKGALDTIVKKTAGLSFAQIELVLIESIKSMILQDRKHLTTQQITSELKYQKSMMAARNREQVSEDE